MVMSLAVICCKNRQPQNAMAIICLSIKALIFHAVYLVFKGLNLERLLDKSGHSCT